MKLETKFLAGLEYSQLVSMHKNGKLKHVANFPDRDDFMATYPLSLLGLVTVTQFTDVCAEIGLIRDNDKFTASFDLIVITHRISDTYTVEECRRDLGDLMVKYDMWDKY
jgi:hypothetical protein